MTDTWSLIVKLRTELVDQLAGIPVEDWDAPSLCPGWRVRDVLAHTILPDRFSPVAMVFGLARHGFSLNKFLHRDAIARGSAPLKELTEQFRRGIPLRTVPPTRTAENVLVDLVIHSQDIRRPLGLAWKYSPEVLALALRTLLADKKSGSPRRVVGLSLTASDMDWSDGTGPAVFGPAEALILTISGRKAALGDLSGPGKETLTARI